MPQAGMRERFQREDAHGLFSAKGAPSSRAWGNAPGNSNDAKTPALKARFIRLSYRR
jgi:hypothetical protein